MPALPKRQWQQKQQSWRRSPLASPTWRVGRSHALPQLQSVSSPSFKKLMLILLEILSLDHVWLSVYVPPLPFVPRLLLPHLHFCWTGELEAFQDVIGTGDQTEMLGRLVSRVASLETALVQSQLQRRKLHNELIELRGNVRIFRHYGCACS